ncbi:MAG: histidine--tRNA ligase [Myxococcaceae bacterium]
MNDLLPGEIEIWHHVEKTAREIFRRCGYSELRTPTVEDTSLFIRSVGEETDIVGKEMYTFEDKSGRSLTLRPEGTAPAARAYIEHAVNNQEPVTHWFYVGQMFRYERMKAGRYRQFSQIGAEAYGAKEPAQDAEMIDLVVQLLEALPLKNISLNLNSLGDDTCRPQYQAALVAHFRSHQSELCADCQRRLETNPLRILDCKVEGCRRIAENAPNVLEFLCGPCRTHFDEVKRKLDALGIKYVVNPRMVRGLDYYTRTAFEFLASSPVLGTASAVGGGGRYDKLVRSLGGPDVPAVGFGLGIERLCMLLAESGVSYAGKPELFIATVDESAHDAALQMAARLRRQGIWVEFDPRGGSLKSQMKRSDKSGAAFTLVLGGDELASGRAKLKPMAGGEPKEIAFADLADALKAARG